MLDAILTVLGVGIYLAVGLATAALSSVVALVLLGGRWAVGTFGVITAYFAVMTLYIIAN